jgi:hypothetical protein
VGVATVLEDEVVLAGTVIGDTEDVVVGTAVVDDPVPLLTLVVEDTILEDEDTLDAPGMESGPGTYFVRS